MTSTRSVSFLFGTDAQGPVRNNVTMVSTESTIGICRDYESMKGYIDQRMVVVHVDAENVARPIFRSIQTEQVVTVDTALSRARSVEQLAPLFWASYQPDGEQGEQQKEMRRLLQSQVAGIHNDINDNPPTRLLRDDVANIASPDECLMCDSGTNGVWELLQTGIWYALLGKMPKPEAISLWQHIVGFLVANEVTESMVGAVVDHIRDKMSEMISHDERDEAVDEARNEVIEELSGAVDRAVSDLTSELTTSIIDNL